MESRLAECLNEVIYADKCPSKLRGILQNVLELDEEISQFDVNDFEEFLESDEFSALIYELFGVDINA